MHSVDHEVMEALLAPGRGNGASGHGAGKLRLLPAPRLLLVIGPGGATVGSLSGGCVEEALIEDLATGRRVVTTPERLDFGLTEEDTASLACPAAAISKFSSTPNAEGRDPRGLHHDPEPA